MGRFPSLMGRLPTLVGLCPECLSGPFSSWKSPGKQPIKKRGIKRFLSKIDLLSCFYQKNPHAHKNKIGTSTPPSKKPQPPPPPKRRNFMGMGFSSKKSQKMPCAHEICGAIFGPRIAGGKIRTQGALKGTNLRGQTEPKRRFSLIFADFCRFSPFPRKQSIWETQIFAENR